MSRAYDAYTVPGLTAALRSLPKESQEQLRRAANDLVGPLAGDARARAARLGGVAALVGRSVKPKRDRVPSVQLGGSGILPPRNGRRRSRLPSQRLNAVWGGAEFGSDRFAQFGSRWTGRDEDAGRFLYPAIRAGAGDITREYLEALDRALRAI
jgi:hypothetical protein